MRDVGCDCLTVLLLLWSFSAPNVGIPKSIGPVSMPSDRRLESCWRKMMKEERKKEEEEED